MRVAIFSDVHGNLTALEAVLQDIDEQEVDQILFAGDLCLFGPRPQACLDRLRNREEIAGIYGNTDEWIDGPPLLSDDIEEEERQRRQRIHDIATWTRETLSAMDRAWLRELPFHRRISPTVNPGDDLFVVHANPVDVNQLIFPPEALQEKMYDKVRQPDGALRPLLEDVACGVLAFGHLHIPFVRPWNDLVLANISSVSMPGDGDRRAKYGILTWDGDNWNIEHRRVDYDIDGEIEAFRSAQPPGWEKSVEALKSDGMIQQKV